MSAGKLKTKYDCGDIEERVQAYLDGYLSIKDVSLFEEHLDYCLPCDKKIEFEKRLKEIIRDRGGEKAIPEHLKAELKNIFKKGKTS
jgi:anti-sigma factor (TIGR02949 family)